MDQPSSLLAVSREFFSAESQNVSSYRSRWKIVDHRYLYFSVLPDLEKKSFNLETPIGARSNDCVKKKKKFVCLCALVEFVEHDTLFLPRDSTSVVDATKEPAAVRTKIDNAVIKQRAE